MKKTSICRFLMAMLILSVICFTLLACEEIDAHKHTFGEWTVVKSATCTESGAIERYCECGEREEQVLAPLGHTAVIDSSVAATCVSTGLSEGSHCSTCGEILRAQETLPVADHTPVIDEAVAATCTAAGKTEGSHCGVCGVMITAQETVPVISHTPVIDKAVAATCTAAGKTEGSHCGVCGVMITAQKTVAANGHTVVIDKAVAATCTAAGKTEGKHCSVCKAVLVKQTAVPAGHKSGAWITDKVATCTEKGKRHQICSVCGETLKTEDIAPAHSWVAATCTEAKHCSVCHITQGSALGHTTDDGTCSRCGKYFSSKYLDIRVSLPMDVSYTYVITGDKSKARINYCQDWQFYGSQYLRVTLVGDILQGFNGPGSFAYVYAYVITPSGKTVRAFTTGSGYSNRPFELLFNGCSEKGTYTFYIEANYRK